MGRGGGDWLLQVATGYNKSIHFEAGGRDGAATVDRPRSSGWGSKCVTVDKSSSQGDDRRERPRAAEVEVKIAKWPQTVVKRYILKPSVVLLW